jgi:hypothetical protein
MKAIGRRGVLLFAVTAVGIMGTAGTASAASIDPGDWDFGAQNVGVVSAPKTFTVTRGQSCSPPPFPFCIPNFGENLNSSVVSGPFAAVPSLGCITPLVSSCDYTVTYLPTAAGPSNGTLTVAGASANLRGTGVGSTPGGGVVKQQVSNQFSFGTLKLNNENGTAQLTVNVPGPGNLALGGNGLVKKRYGGGATASKAVGAAGKVTLLIKAKGQKKQKLNDNGKVTVRPKITFSPTGGTPATQTKRIVLKKNV